MAEGKTTNIPNTTINRVYGMSQRVIGHFLFRYKRNTLACSWTSSPYRPTINNMYRSRRPKAILLSSSFSSFCSLCSSFPFNRTNHSTRLIKYRVKRPTNSLRLARQRIPRDIRVNGQFNVRLFRRSRAERILPPSPEVIVWIEKPAWEKGFN